jgi:hypothetical protein
MKRLSHGEALVAIDESRDRQLEPGLQQLLDEHLAECADCRAYQAEFIQLENHLSRSLQRRWPAEQAEDDQIASILEKLSPHTRQKTMKPFFSNTLRLVAWSTLAVLVIALLGWGIQNLRPAPASTSAADTRLPTAIEPTIQATERLPEITSTSAEKPALLPENTPIPQPGSARSMPGIQFNFTSGFPQSPEQVSLYRLALPDPVNADSARQVAELWGVENPTIYKQDSSEAPDYVLMDATNGVELMHFVNFAEQFLFWPNNASVLDDNGPILPFEQQVEIATAYLQGLGMLSEPYRIMPVAEERSKVRFVQILDDLPVIYGIGTNRGSTEWIDVAVDSAGKIAEVDVALHDFQPAGEYPILTAQQAWERFASETSLQHANYAVLGLERPVTYQSWTRNSDYQVGQAVDLYGYVTVMQPVEPEKPASVTINNLNVNTDPASFSSANPWDFIHLWGEMIEKPDGSLTVNMYGWETSPLNDEILTGTIQHQGEQGLFSTKSGDYFLPDLPENFPEGAVANVRGVIMQGNPPIFEWSNIDTGEIPFYYGSVLSCGGGGGGGGGGPENANFGGGSIRGLNLSGVPVDEAPVAGSPYASGDPIEAVSGIPYITIYQYASGLQEEEIFFTPDTGADLAGEVNYALEGAVLGNMLTQNNPVRIWGQVDRYEPETSTVVIDVNKFEPVYPGLQIQQWAGTEEIANIEGRDVILFTTTDGQIYVTSSSLMWPAKDMLIGLPGDLIGIEGYVLPDQLYGGYAIIKELGGEVPPDNVIQSAQPTIIDATMMGGDNQEQYLVGQVIIEKIELAYKSISMQRCTSDFANYPDADQFLIVQPVWVFTGTFEDGRQFQLQVQALPDEYLY